MSNNNNSPSSSSSSSPSPSSSAAADDLCNLIVNYLPKSYDERAFFALFAPFGTILSCKLVLDRTTRASLCYGFIRFDSPADAAAAILALNGTTVADKVLKVSYARANTADARLANVYVANLEPAWLVSDLNALFGRFGSIVESRVLLDAQGASRNVGFVRFEHKECAQQAIQALNGHRAPGSNRVLTVRIANNSHSASSSSSSSSASLPMSSPSPSTSSATSFHVSSPLPPSPTLPPSATLIADHPHPHPHPHHPSRSNHHLNHGVGQFAAADECAVYVSGLPRYATNMYLVQLFAPYGPLLDAHAMRDAASGMCRGYGFVRYADAPSVLRAIAALHGMQMEHGRYLLVRPKVSQPHVQHRPQAGSESAADSSLPQ